MRSRLSMQGLLATTAGLAKASHKSVMAIAVTRRSFFSGVSQMSVRSISKIVPLSMSLMTTSQIHISMRCQGSLQRLLQDPEDAYLAAIEQLDVQRIASVALAGPPLSRHPSGRTWAEEYYARTRRGEFGDAEARQVPQSSAEAVLEGLREEGLRKQEESDEARALAMKRAYEAYDALSAEAKAAIETERRGQHLFEALCAVNAVMRLQMADGSATAADMDSTYAVYEEVMKRRKDGSIAVEMRWEEDFVPELKDITGFLKVAGDTRTVTF